METIEKIKQISCDFLGKENKAKWLEALRSGKYQQSVGRLRTEHGFCCLGVLCDVMDPEGWKKEKTNWFHHHGQALPDYVKLFQKPYSFYFHADCSTLASMNDEGKSFAEIADWIEENM